MIKLPVDRSLTAQLLLESPRPIAPLLVPMTSRFWEAQVDELQSKLIGIPQTAAAALGRMMTAIVTYVTIVFSKESRSWTWWLPSRPCPGGMVGPLPPRLASTVVYFFFRRLFSLVGVRFAFLSFW